MTKYDVIVIGAGNGGLAAAAMACLKGYKTLLFEKHNLPGGSASSFRRGRFEFEPSCHEIAEVGSPERPGPTRQLFKDLGSDANFVYEDSLYRVICTDPKEPFDVKFPAGLENLYNKIEEISPGSRQSVVHFFEYQKKAMDMAEKLNNKDFHLKDLPEIFNMMRFVSRPADKIMTMFGIPKKVQHMLSAYWTYVGEPTSTLNAFMLGMMDYVYTDHGAGLPSMFSHELSLSFDKTIRENGGQIFYNSPVRKILVKKRKAYGVIANGQKYYADYIICNAFPNDVFGRMISKREVPLIEIKRANSRELALSFVNVYLGLNKSAQELGINDYTTFLLQKADSTAQYKECFGLGGKGWVIVNNLNVAIPDCSPEGTSHMSLTCAVYGDAWSKIEPQNYKKTKLKIAEEMIEYYQNATGIIIRPYIEEIEVATPVTFSRYLGTPNGTPYGYQTRDWDGIFLRTMNLLKERTLKNFRFCGAHTENSLGYNQTYKSGKIAVEELEKKQK